MSTSYKKAQFNCYYAILILMLKPLTLLHMRGYYGGPLHVRDRDDDVTTIMDASNRNTMQRNGLKTRNKDINKQKLNIK